MKDMDKNHIMYKLFLAFEQNNINYLHFKSNTNLSDSFSGKGDFDVLVDKSEIVKVEELILAHNGKRHNPTTVGNYVGVDNWLVFDENTGIIHHLHLHYQLVTGKQFVKDYVLPWNELLFSSRIKDSEYRIYITNPNVELLLLAYRSVLKAKFFDYIKKLLGIYHMDRSMQKEWNDMICKISPSELESFTNLVCPNEAEEMISIVSKKKPTSRDYLWLHNTVRTLMKPYRRYGAFTATMKTLQYQFYYKFSRYWNRLTGSMAITKKISLQGGLIIAFVGVDGAGKSTVSDEISIWIRKKIECRRFYMGTGEGSLPFSAKLIGRVASVGGFLRKKTGENKAHKIVIKTEQKNLSLLKNPKSFIHQYLKMQKIISVQRNNFVKIQKMQQYRLNGGISVLDRWPQMEYVGQNDGPKIVEFKNIFGNKKFIKSKINKEIKYLGIVKTIKPDYIFRLNISLDTCMRRKPEHKDSSYYKKKIEDLMNIKFEGSKIIEIDAELPYEEEILLIKRILWKYI